MQWKKPAVIIACALLFLRISAGGATANHLPFDESWQAQGFLWKRDNTYKLEDEKLAIFSDASVSMIFRRLPTEFRTSRKVTWQWAVSESVSPTDLSRKGGDDRNISLYFIFSEDAALKKLESASVLNILRDKRSRALVYVWGGEHNTGDILASPYSPDRMKTIILRRSGVGHFDETIDLQKDFKLAFGVEIGALIGLAVSADSDDTDGKIQAEISNLVLFH